MFNTANFDPELTTNQSISIIDYALFDVWHLVAESSMPKARVRRKSQIFTQKDRNPGCAITSCRNGNINLLSVSLSYLTSI